MPLEGMALRPISSQWLSPSRVISAVPILPVFIYSNGSFTSSVREALLRQQLLRRKKEAERKGEYLEADKVNHEYRELLVKEYK